MESTCFTLITKALYTTIYNGKSEITRRAKGQDDGLA